jgi:uncharacterized integral membrane protein
VRIVLIVVSILAAVIFAVQNADVVTIDLLFWKARASLAIVAVGCMAAGVIVGALVLVPRLYRMRAHERRLRTQLADLDMPDATKRTPATGATSSQAIAGK